jgi:hypothetical protein
MWMQDVGGVAAQRLEVLEGVVLLNVDIQSWSSKSSFSSVPGSLRRRDRERHRGSEVVVAKVAPGTPERE